MVEDEGIENGDAPDEAGGAGEGGKRRKARRSFAERASANLRAARKSLQDADVKPAERAQLMLAEANVLALLELADSIRTARDGDR
jgi:hypothetical protein